jgi:hypothetical protein
LLQQDGNAKSLSRSSPGLRLFRVQKQKRRPLKFIAGGGFSSPERVMQNPGIKLVCTPRAKVHCFGAGQASIYLELGIEQT